uniref:Uncharacterized protein n=1 Tax=Rhizophora mucronata TaxID=61149 RepID=A0A2P2MYE6_RHIMU
MTQLICSLVLPSYFLSSFFFTFQGRKVP